jgi:ubiquinone biosynthesis protein
LSLTVTHIWRVLRWGRTLGRHGALRPFETLQDMPASLRLLARLARIGSFAPKEPRFAKALEALGPAAIKLGQALATRPDLVGAAAARDLTKLQDKLPPFPFAEIEKAITADFGAAPSVLYASIDPVAVGAASIAQVHRARTQDGKDVAIKVLRPNIERDLADHISTYQWLAAKLEAFGGEAARLRPRLVIETFRTWVNREVDLRLEAASASELAENMRADARYHVPSVDWQRTSRRVLTIDWIDGTPLTDPKALDQAGVDRPALARTLVLTFLKQAIQDGVFHADMHHGNLFVDAQGRLNVIDFGIMGRLDPLARRYLAEILHGLHTRNYRRVAQIHFEAGYVPLHHSVQDFASALRAVGEPIFGKPIKDISPARLLDQLFAITRSFDMQTQPHLLLLQKTLMMVEGMALHIDPDANMWDIAAPYLRDWIRDELGPEVRLADGIRQLFRDASQLPDLLRRAGEQLPHKSAAPPSPPLPALPAGKPWGLYGVILLVGALAGWLIGR